MRLLVALLFLGGSAALQGRILSRRGQRGELWAMAVLTAITAAAFVVYEVRPQLLQSLMTGMRHVFTPVGDWILGR